MGRAGLHPSAAARWAGSRPEIKSSILFLASDVDVDVDNNDDGDDGGNDVDSNDDDDDGGNDGVDDDGC